MSKLKILIVEDDYSYALELEIFLEELGYECIGLVDNAKDALPLIKESHPDLILIDVFLNGEMDGIELGMKIKKQDIPIVYLSAYNERELYERAKGTNIFAYIVKPVDELTLRSILDVLKREKFEEDSTSKQLYVRMQNQYLKVPVDEILWIRSEGNYCEIITENKKFITKNSLIKLKESLSEKDFIQVYRSFLINIKKIENLNTKENIVWIGNEKIPVGRKYKANLIKRLYLI